MGISAFVQEARGADIASYASMGGALLCVGIAVLSVKYGEKTITRGDWVCFILALGAIPLWVMTDRPIYAALLISFIDAVGFIPTYRKTWSDPYSENRSMYLLYTVTDMMICLSVTPLALASVLHPCTSVVTNGLMLLLILVRRDRMSRLLRGKWQKYRPVRLLHAFKV